MIFAIFKPPGTANGFGDAATLRSGLLRVLDARGADVTCSVP